MDKTVEAKLDQLFKVQTIDSKIDKIHAVRGELPMEVADLEDEIEGLHTRVDKLKAEIEARKEDIEGQKQAMKDSDGLIKRYDEQLTDVKNNREYLALTKEIELQKLEKMASEKKINDFQSQIEEKTEQIEASKKLAAERDEDLAAKRKELDSITSETAKEEEELVAVRDQIRNDIEPRLVKAYDKIRRSYKNGLAVVTIERESCGGCFSIIPPQLQLDISQHKKIIACEHCGRVLIDHDLAEKVKKNVDKKVSA